MKIFTQIHDFCVRVTSSKIFKNTIVLIILINSIVLGLITSEAIYAKFGELLEFILSACVVIFTVEITLRIIAKLRHIVSAILVSAPHVFWAAVLEMIIFYIFGIMGQNLFHEAFPQWFGTLGETVYTLFQVTTLESWSMGIARPVMKVYPWAWCYFVPFVMISSYIVLNVVVGVVVNATSDISEDDNISMKDKIKAKKVVRTLLINADRLHLFTYIKLTIF